MRGEEGRADSVFDLVGHGDAGDMLKDPISHGFPPVPAEQIPPCGITEQDTPCTWHRIVLFPALPSIRH